MTIQINGTSGISGVDGSAGTPALQGSDTNTGISFGADTVNINTGGTTRATVDSSGRFGIGTTSFSGNEKLNVSSSSGSTAISTKCAGGGLYTASVLFGAEGFGNVGGLEFDDANARFRLHTAGNRPLLFSTDSTERMRITSGGALYFNATSEPNSSVSGAALIPAGNGALFRVARSGTANQGHLDFFNGNGGVGSITTSGSSTAYNTTSDYRLKENIVAVTDGIVRLQQLKPSRFNFIADPDKTVDGFIAHEVQVVVPEAIAGEKDAVDDEGNPVYQGIDQSKLVPLLTAALQEAIAKIESLETRLTALEGGPAQ